MSESSRANWKIFRVALYGLITLLSIVTLGFTSAIIDAGGFPRLLQGSSSRDAVLLLFAAVRLLLAASLSGILCGSYRSIQAFRGQREISTGHRIGVAATFLLFLVGACLLTSWRALVLASPICRAVNTPYIRRPGPYTGYYDYDYVPRCEYILEKSLITPLFGCAWATTALLFVALCASIGTQATPKKEEETVAMTHVVLEKA